MNSTWKLGRRVGFGWLGMVALLLLVGCATHRVDWGSRIGTYTFDNAVIELGPPDKQAKLEDGTLVADWLTRRGSTFAYPAYGFVNSPYWYATPPVPTYVDTPDYFLRLIFAPDGKLRSWKRFAR